MHCTITDPEEIDRQVAAKRAEARLALADNDFELAKKLEKQADLIQDSVIIYSLVSGPRGRLTRAEIIECIEEIKTEADELLRFLARTKSETQIQAIWHRGLELGRMLTACYDRIASDD